MFNFHKNEKGQTALETAIILIAFIVVASVFAFTILSAGSASTERGEAAIYSGLEGVQSSLALAGQTIANSDTSNLTSLVVTVSSAAGEPVEMADGTNNLVVVSYRDATQYINDLPWTLAWVGPNDGDNILEDGELAEMTIDVSSAAVAANIEFNLEVKPPTGAILNINRTTPATLDAVMQLR